MKNTIDMDLARSIDPDAWRKIHKDDEEWCQKFADLIRCNEREACANLVFHSTPSDEYECPLVAVYKAILARGKT